MTRTQRSFVITIHGDPDGQIKRLDPTLVRFALTRSDATIVIPTQDIDVYEVSGNIDVQNSGQPKRKRNPKVNANRGMDLDEALAIACQEPMSQAQKRQRDLLIVESLNAGLTPSQMADKTGLSVQSILSIRREHRASAHRT